MAPDVRDRIAVLAASVDAHLRWRLLLRTGWTNRKVDRLLHPATVDALAALGIPVGDLDLSSADLDRLLEDGRLARFRGGGGYHYKPVEYLASLELLDLADGEVLLDAGGGPTAEFLAVASAYTGRSLELVCQDLRAPARVGDGVRFLRGDLCHIDLPDGSVDAIACHQTLQLLRGDGDMRFMEEAARLLRPGGRLVVIPILLADRYAEINNRLWPGGGVGDGPGRLRDVTAACAGWGPHGGFSRVLDPGALASRVLAHLPTGFQVSLHRVLVEGTEAPDLARNRNLPRFNGAMKALVVGRIGA